MATMTLRRTQSFDFKSFVNGEKIRKVKGNKRVKYYVYYSQAVGIFMLVAPSIAQAQSKNDATFNELWSAVMGVVDWIAVGVFVFAGTSWMLGHRTKAIELVIGGACGYLLARHAVDIKDFLKGIGGGE